VFEFRHSRKPDSIRYFPIRLARLIVSYALAAEQMRRFGKHSLRHVGLLHPRIAMADSAMLVVDLSARQVSFVSRSDGSGLRHFFVDVRVQGAVRQPGSKGSGLSSTAAGARPETK